MNTFQTRSSYSDVAAEQISEGTLAYFSERARLKIFNMVMSELKNKIETDKHFTRTLLAKKIRKSPSRLTKMLASPGNWTIDTISELLLGICGAEPVIEKAVIELQSRRNHTRPEWLDSPPTPAQPSITVDPKVGNIPQGSVFSGNLPVASIVPPSLIIR